MKIAGWEYTPESAPKKLNGRLARMPKGLTKISKPLALRLLSLCDGDEIWSCDYCRTQRVPEDWIVRLRDIYESNFADPGSTIYQEGNPLPHYEGVRSVDIAVCVAENLSIKVDPWVLESNHRAVIVAWIKERVEED